MTAYFLWLVLLLVIFGVIYYGFAKTTLVIGLILAGLFIVAAIAAALVDEFRGSKPGRAAPATLLAPESELKWNKTERKWDVPPPKPEGVERARLAKVAAKDQLMQAREKVMADFDRLMNDLREANGEKPVCQKELDQMQRKAFIEAERKRADLPLTKEEQELDELRRMAFGKDERE
jgi:hypothetical protein